MVDLLQCSSICVTSLCVVAFNVRKEYKILLFFMYPRKSSSLDRDARCPRTPYL